MRRFIRNYVRNIPFLSDSWWSMVVGVVSVVVCAVSVALFCPLLRRQSSWTLVDLFVAFCSAVLSVFYFFLMVWTYFKYRHQMKPEAELDRLYAMSDTALQAEIDELEAQQRELRKVLDERQAAVDAAQEALAEVCAEYDRHNFAEEVKIRQNAIKHFQRRRSRPSLLRRKSP